jgi:hypothetical protein
MGPIGIANDGTHIYAEVHSNGQTYVWGEHPHEGHIPIKHLEIVRRLANLLPAGEYPADLITYERGEAMATYEPSTEQQPEQPAPPDPEPTDPQPQPGEPDKPSTDDED